MTETKEIINCFHKDYVKTYMQDFMKSIQVQNKHKMSSHSMAELTDEARKTNPTHGTIHHLIKPLHVNRVPQKMGVQAKGYKMTMAEVMDDLVEVKQKKLTTKEKIDLAPREFKIYSRAGTANVTPKGKKK